jgi:hypothetical protein
MTERRWGYRVQCSTCETVDTFRTRAEADHCVQYEHGDGHTFTMTTELWQD